MTAAKPDPKTVKNFPLDNPKASIVVERGKLYVVERTHLWDSEKKRKSEQRFYLGRIVDGVYYTTADYRRKFKRDGSLRVIEKPHNRPYRRKARLEVQTPAATPVESTPKATPKAAADEVAPAPLKAKRVGLTAVFIAISKQIGLWDDVSATWGEVACATMHSLACHWLMTHNNACYLFKSWAQQYALPFTRPADAKELTELFQLIGSREGWEQRFFSARIRRMGDDEVFSYDATNIATKATGILDAQTGKSKEGGYRRQIGMSVLFGHNTGLPAMFRLFPGNIADVSTVADLMTRVELIAPDKIFAAVLDRGYFSLDNLARCIDGGKRVLIAAKTNVSWVRDVIESQMGYMWDARYRLKDQEVWGKTAKTTVSFADGKERTVWVHVFREDMKSHLENSQLFGEIDDFEKLWNAASTASELQQEALLKSKTLNYFEQPTGRPGCCELVRDYDAINQATRYFGFFASVSTMECTAQEALETYGKRDLIEKCFEAGKTSVNMDVIRSHTDATISGRFVVSFIALTILSALRNRMRERVVDRDEQTREIKREYRPLSEELSFNSLLNTMGSIQLIYGAPGTKPRYLEVTEKQRLIAHRLGCGGVYDTVPEYACVE